MCHDIPGEPPLKRIAVCACNHYFVACDKEEAFQHITARSSPNHYWVWADTPELLRELNAKQK